MDTLNYQGVKFGQQITDFILGVSFSPDSQCFNLSGNWKQYRSIHELQNKGWETYACTLFGGSDAIEALFNLYLLTGRISPADIKWLQDNGYLQDGRINFSDRFPAQFAEVEIGVGTYQYKANNALRKYLIPEAMFPYVTEGYYDKSKITPEMMSLAEEFCKRFFINWYWVENTEYILQKTPMSAVVHFANGDGILKPEGAFNHCIFVDNEESDCYDIDDSYAQQDKRYGKDFVSNFVGYSLTLNTTLMNVDKFLKDNDLKFVRNQNTGGFGRVLQGMLRTIETTDRATLLLFDEMVRKNGIQITQGEWQTLVDAKKVKPF